MPQWKIRRARSWGQPPRPPARPRPQTKKGGILCKRRRWREGRPGTEVEVRGRPRHPVGDQCRGRVTHELTGLGHPQRLVGPGHAKSELGLPVRVLRSFRSFSWPASALISSAPRGDEPPRIPGWFIAQAAGRRSAQVPLPDGRTAAAFSTGGAHNAITRRLRRVATIAGSVTAEA